MAVNRGSVNKGYALLKGVPTASCYLGSLKACLIENSQQEIAAQADVHRDRSTVGS